MAKQKLVLVTDEMVAERDRLRAERDRLKAELATAEQRVVETRENFEETEARSPRLHTTDTLRDARRTAQIAVNTRNALRDDLRATELALAQAESTCSVPERLESARTEFDAATAEVERIEVGVADVATKLDGLRARETELAGKIARVDAANSAALLAGKEPDLTAMVRADAERRALSGAVTSLDARLAELNAERATAADRLAEARAVHRDAAARVAQLEADALLRPILPVLVKVQFLTARDPRRILVLVPEAIVAEIEAAMAREGA